MSPQQSGSVEVKVDLKQAERRLDTVWGALLSLEPVFAGPIDKSVSQLFINQFTTEGEYGGDGIWKPLSPMTLALRKRRGHGRGGIEQDTRRLWASLVKVGPESYRVIGPHSYQRGTTLPYAIFQQRGFASKMIFGRLRKTATQVPARPIVPHVIPDELVRAWERMISNFIDTGKTHLAP